MLTQKRLKEVLSYDSASGRFAWGPHAHRIRHRAEDGQPGSINDGYRYIRIEGKRYRASRLVWLYVYGHWPTTKQIDHINGRRSDDRVSNLREATSAENNQNRGHHKNNTSGIRGVRFEMGKWRAQIRVNGRSTHIGIFGSPEEASQAYLAARAIAFPFQPSPRES